jgi:hypothetical protein
MTIRRALLGAALCALVLPLTASAAKPIVTVPADMTVEAQNPGGASVPYTASAADDHGRPIPVTCAPASGSLFGFGTTTVTCAARDGGDTTTKRFQITVVDTKPPVITVPGPRRVTTTSRSGRVVTYAASASDLVDGTVAVTCTPASGALFPVGTTSVTCTAGDRNGNRAAASFSVTVVKVAKRTARNTAMIAPTAGARVSVPPLLRWRRVAKARFYNVQVFRHGHKVLSAWPARARFRMHRRWTFGGRKYRLKPGPYTWLVWPAFGAPTKPRYGRLLGQSTFVVVR